MPEPVPQSGFDPVPMRIHPRVFAALGADLVTNDVVAVIELVKNAYDAFAHNVWLRFNYSAKHGPFIEIEDDGCGMTRANIEDSWCCIATPYKQQHPIITNMTQKRRVTGEKGLGRLAVSRLGNRLRMLTKATGKPCWEVQINWTDLASSNDLSDSFAYCREHTEPPCFKETGTRLQIYDIKAAWNRHRIEDLSENLARLISPFSEVRDFDIFLNDGINDDTKSVQIKPPRFLSSPKYSIKGSADSRGNVKASYQYVPTATHESVEKELVLHWPQIFELMQYKGHFPHNPDSAQCGKFKFEFRVWDLDSDSIQEISQRFELTRLNIRKAIRVHKGISIYRDKILVLPKSDNSRDWLGLDLRRVSRVGTRLSTNQIVGSVFITKQDNPKIDDTSDRERLVLCPEVAEFEEILKAVIGLLEIERDENRSKPERQQPLLQIFERLSTKQLSSEVAELSLEKSQNSKVLRIVRNFERSLHLTRGTLERYFIDYSRLATVGTVAHMLVHEIRNRTTAIGAFLRNVTDRFGPFNDTDIAADFRSARSAISALERLADTFSPLATRRVRRRRRHSVVEDRIRSCLQLRRNEIARKRIKCEIPDSHTTVAVDPGELDAVILNLVENSLYWMANTPRDDRLLQFSVSICPSNANRAQVSVRDYGSGIAQQDLSRVFLPGMTRKPDGIGMGLTVASELVATYGGQMVAESPSLGQGAMFVFDLPLASQNISTGSTSP